MTTIAPHQAITTPTQIFLVDDHPLVREWLSNLIDQQSDLKVCGEAEDAISAFGCILEQRPHLAIIDISLKNTSGIELIKNLRISCPDLKIVVLSMHEECFYAERAFKAGAQAYVIKQETTKTVVAAIRAVLSGQTYLSPKLVAILGEKEQSIRSKSRETPISVLSDRELEVFEMLGQGKGTPQIAEILKISLKTVQAYCARIKDKLDLKNATELLREAILWEETRQVRGKPLN